MSMERKCSEEEEPEQVRVWSDRCTVAEEAVPLAAWLAYWKPAAPMAPGRANKLKTYDP